MDQYEFRAAGQFLNRSRDLARMHEWWNGPDRNALVLHGRRRVGKSWLFRRFAHGKRAIVLVADQRAPKAQLGRFADALTPLLGVRPDIPDVAGLFGVLLVLAADEKTLVVIDEFPYLLPAKEKQRYQELTAVQAVFEERDASQLKLILCGSHIAQMTTLLSNESPLRGRLTPLPILPLTFDESSAFLPKDLSAEARVERYAVGGGMTMYLNEIASDGDLRAGVCKGALDSKGPLFNDPREVLEEELRQPGTYFSLLEELSKGKRSSSDLASALGAPTKALSPYLKALVDMQVIERVAPIDAGRDYRDYRYRIEDGFLRFWFRFVFPFQDDLRSGLLPDDLYDAEVAPALADHVSPVFEKLCREWTRRTLGNQATRVGTWWGNATKANRSTGDRHTEEVDIAGTRQGRVTVVGECKWTNRALGMKVLADLEEHKLPAMREAGLKVATKPQILLFSRSGFGTQVTAASRRRDDLRLVHADELSGER